jgi:hypothetical protein
MSCGRAEVAILGAGWVCHTAVLRKMASEMTLLIKARAPQLSIAQ